MLAPQTKQSNSNSRTVVTYLLDRSGSMEPIRDLTIEVFNGFLCALKDGEAAIEFTLLQFDSESLDKICVRVPVDEVHPLTRETFRPRAGTPLIDAAYKTIRAVEASLKDEPDTKVVIVLHTDGEENSSTEHTWQELQALIREIMTLGWQIIFKGAGFDAYEQASRMGIGADSTISYQLDPDSTHAAFAASAENIRAFAQGLTPRMTYSAAQKTAAGDRFTQTAARQRQHRSSVETSPKSIVEDFKL